MHVPSLRRARGSGTCRPGSRQIWRGGAWGNVVREIAYREGRGELGDSRCGSRVPFTSLRLYRWVCFWLYERRLRMRMRTRVRTRSSTREGREEDASSRSDVVRGVYRYGDSVCAAPGAPSTQHLESAARGRRPLQERHDAHARTLYGPSGTLPLLDHVYRPMTGEFCIQNPLVIARRECGISRCPKPSPSLALDLHAACGSAPCLSLSLALHPHPHAHVPSRARYRTSEPCCPGSYDECPPTAHSRPATLPDLTPLRPAPRAPIWTGRSPRPGPKSKASLPHHGRGPRNERTNERPSLRTRQGRRPSRRVAANPALWFVDRAAVQCPRRRRVSPVIWGARSACRYCTVSTGTELDASRLAAACGRVLSALSPTARTSWNIELPQSRVGFLRLRTEEGVDRAATSVIRCAGVCSVRSQYVTEFWILDPSCQHSPPLPHRMLKRSSSLFVLLYIAAVDRLKLRASSCVLRAVFCLLVCPRCASCDGRTRETSGCRLRAAVTSSCHRRTNDSGSVRIQRGACLSLPLSMPAFLPSMWRARSDDSAAQPQ